MLWIQQTPKPAAQWPSAVPLFVVHSDEDKQEPVTATSEADVHTSFLAAAAAEKEIIIWKAREQLIPSYTTTQSSILP